MTWGGIKKGDAVLEVQRFGVTAERSEGRIARSVGAKWITTSSGRRYDAATGGGESGWSVHTDATYEASQRREAALRRVHDTHWFSVNDDQLQRIVAILDETPGTRLQR